MAGTFQNLHICHQCAVVDGGGGLADTAAVSQDGFGTGVRRCGLVTLCGGTLADDLIEVEHLAGQKDRAVNSLAGDLHISGTVTVTCLVRVVGGQNIPEQNGGYISQQLFRGGHGEGELQNSAVLSGGDSCLGCVQIELITESVEGDLKGFGIHLRIHGKCAEFCVYSIQINGIGKGFGTVAYHSGGAVDVSLVDLLHQSLLVVVVTGSAHGDHKGLQIGRCLCSAEIRCFADNFPLCLSQNAGGSQFQRIQLGGDCGFVDSQVGRDVSDQSGGAGQEFFFLLLDGGTGTAECVCGFDSGRNIQLGADNFGCQLNLLIQDLYGDGFLQQRASQFLIDLVDRIFFAQTADIHTGDGNIFEDQTVISQISQLGNQKITGSRTEQKNGDQNADGDHQTVATFFGLDRLCFFELTGLFAGGLKQLDIIIGFLNFLVGFFCHGARLLSL